ncbi:hypothetical protein [Pseudoalteromonas sp. L21]|uniref:hypothetical protein n=1 Tax=Pseudoalteromonas sp. L21 TaxID=1539746 RepID=UPI001F2F424E|nr:hypothetical protein [Pseudoalteromonas sp. L21]MCF7519395.1 hypothetical protein [Pseudoalteromonas sp. L21]
MRPSEVSTQQIVDAGFEIQRTGSTVSGYKLKKVIGKGRPERLMEVWEQEMNGRPEVYDSDEPHVLEPEVEELLAELNDKISKELHGILVKVDKKIRNMADKKVNLIKQDFEVEGQNLYAQIDELEAFIGSLELDNDKLRMKLYEEQSKPNEQFENEKTILKLRDRLRGKTELLNERQLRIDELTELTQMLREAKA